MKWRNILFSSLSIVFLTCSCSEKVVYQKNETVELNEVGKNFMNYLMHNSNWQEEWLELSKLGTVEPNLAYYSFGGGYGPHYVLPVTCDNILKAIVIYPFDLERRQLKMPTIIDGSNINDDYAGQSVLRSPVRGDWQKAGIHVEEDLFPIESRTTELLSSRSNVRQYTTFYWITCSNSYDEYGVQCNSINKDGFLSMCKELIREMLLPVDVFVDDEKIALIGRPSFSQNPDIVVEYFVALRERLQMRYCYISYFFWWDPNSVMNADPDDYSWDTSKIDNSSEGDGGQDVDYPVGTQIVDSLALAENPYIDCIYKKLSTKSSTFRYYLGRFMGENSIAHLKFKLSDNLSSTVNGRFKCKMEDYWFSIELNEVRLMNLTPLMVAKTIMHEVIHADIFAKLMSLKSSLKSNLSVDEMKELSEALNDQNFPTLNYYYEKYVFDVTAQHQYMAEYFVDVIAAVLQEIDPTVSKETRTAIAWIGLTETKTVIDGKVIDVETEAWKALPTAEKKKLVEAYREYLETAKNECED